MLSVCSHGGTPGPGQVLSVQVLSWRRGDLGEGKGRGIPGQVPVWEGEGGRNGRGGGTLDSDLNLHFYFLTFSR